MVRPLSQRQLAVVERDRDLPSNVVDAKVHAVARLESQELELMSIGS